MAKYHISAEILDEADGKLHLLSEDGVTVNWEGDGIAILCVTERDGGIEVSAALHGLTVYQLAQAIAGHKKLLRAADLAVHLFGPLMKAVREDKEEDADATD